MPTSNDPDRYALVIEGVRWEYVNARAMNPWERLDSSLSYTTTDGMLTMYPASAPAILGIVKRWHEDRMPRVRRRVVECDGELFCVTLEGGISHCDVWHGPEKARQWAAEGDEDHTPAQVRVMADLIANPDEPEPTDGN